MSTGEGPCLQAALDDIVVRTDDFRDEPRFPHYAPEVVKLGVVSALSFKLYTAERTAGALNLFGYEPTRSRDVHRHGTSASPSTHASAASPPTSEPAISADAPSREIRYAKRP